ncbi:MAG: PEP-CTERM system histidine kinase PrsK, partial [Novosphingobium sp.]|nr:PEP-CTERM system histidine kinase PrsK [Novosphingobium sp.]
VTLTKHLFQHRYDYRAAWLGFTQTMGRAGPAAPPLEQRVIQALADITESPAGLLLAPNDQGELELAARWQWPTAEVPAVALGPAARVFLERNSFIVDLTALHAGVERRGEGAVLPEWLRTEPRAWALVPLLHFDRLVGAVVLARPAVVRQLDWEDFDLLRIVGRQLASYLAEHAGQEALAEAGRFDDFHRRIAFVMHDIKNLASQLSLLARNAEQHSDKPEFRADMLVTLRNSADRLNTMLARLSRYGGAVERIESVDAVALVEAVVAQFRPVHQVTLTERQPCRVSADHDSLDQVLRHLIQNALDASPPDTPVFIAVTSDGLQGRIEVVDTGSGMSPEFVRSRLFKPFVSTKPGGFGIGAYEARELVKAMRGRLEVESREGLGSRFTIRLPLAAAAELLETFVDGAQKVA